MCKALKLSTRKSKPVDFKYFINGHKPMGYFSIFRCGSLKWKDHVKLVVKQISVILGILVGI